MKFFFILTFFLNIHSSDFTVHTFKKGNLRLSLSPIWKINKESFQDETSFLATNMNEFILLKIEAKKQNKDNFKTKFNKIIKLKNFKLLNFTDLSKEAEYTFDSIEGYFSTVESGNKKGYFVFSRDGVNELQIYIYTDEKKFSDNFRSMKETLSMITNNVHFKLNCCEILQNKKELDINCKFFFENYNKRICKFNN